MKTLHKVLLGLALLLVCVGAQAQSICMSSDSNKQSVVVSVTSAATTALVAPVANTTIYVCAFTISVSQVVTTPNTFKLVQGTGAACVTGQTNLTGLYGDGGVTAAAPIVVIYSPTGAAIKGTLSAGLCITTAIGATGSFQGMLTYVQQ